MADLLKVEINFEYHETETDLSNCSTCNQVIVGKMFQMVVFVNNDPVYTQHKFCESCHELENESS